MKVGVKLTVHEPDERVQNAVENVPFALADQPTVPVGEEGEEPVTVALHFVWVPVTVRAGVQTTKVAEVLL